jgi:hypothetical protein
MTGPQHATAAQSERRRNLILAMIGVGYRPPSLAIERHTDQSDQASGLVKPCPARWRNRAPGALTHQDLAAAGLHNNTGCATAGTSPRQRGLPTARKPRGLRGIYGKLPRSTPRTATAASKEQVQALPGVRLAHARAP